MAEKLNNLTHQIEGDLSTLKKDPAYVFKSERVYKCRGKNLNMLGNSNLKKSITKTKTTNGIDLLEVYCDTESQLTKQVNLLGVEQFDLPSKMGIWEHHRVRRNCGHGFTCWNPATYG